MSELLNSKYYDMEYDNLLVSGNHSPDVKVIVIASGQGVIKRGTVLGLTSGSEYVVLGTELDENVTSSANCIVADAVDTGSDSGDDVAVSVYISGHFNSNALTVEEEYSMTDTDKEDLRTVGLYISSSNTI